MKILTSKNWGTGTIYIYNEILNSILIKLNPKEFIILEMKRGIPKEFIIRNGHDPERITEVKLLSKYFDNKKKDFPHYMILFQEDKIDSITLYNDI
jgi:hypothetical protein